MAKKNKKNIPNTQQKREQETQKIKIFIHRTRELLTKLVSKEAAETISADYLKFVYNTFPRFARCQTPASKQAVGEANGITKFILYQTSLHTIRFPYDQEKEISIRDFFEIWRPLMFSFDMDVVKINKQLRRDANRIVDLLQPHVFKQSDPEDIGVKFDRLGNKYPFTVLQLYAYEMMRGILAVIGQALSHPCVEYTMLSMPALESNNYRDPIHFEVWKIKAKKILIELKNQNRTLFRLYNHSFKMTLDPISIKVPENPNVPFKLSEKYDVYIQTHAINRMLERLYGLDRANAISDFFKSFTENEICWFDNQLLIEYKTNDIKTGYLYTTLHKNFVIVRSFLFLTYKSTPEGKQLHAHTGLQKEDIQYLQIDKLSAFMAIDFKKEQRIAEIFRNCGLGNLIDNIDIVQETQDDDIEIKQIKEDFIIEFIEKAKQQQAVEYIDYEDL